MSESPQEVLPTIAGWEDAVFTTLQGGYSNRTWLLTSGDCRGVLKIDAAPRRPPYNTRIAEQRVQSMAAEAGIASPVVYASERVYLSEYVDGRVWSKDDLDCEANLVQLVKLLRRLHALPLTGRRLRIIDAAEVYARTIDESASPLAQHCLETVKRLDAPVSICCCHNDLVVENIVATPGLRLLDWEYACDNDPLFDLATVVAHHDLSYEQRDFLLDRYFAGEGARWLGKMEQQVTLYNALVWLWQASLADPDPGQLSILESRLQQ